MTFPEGRLEGPLQPPQAPRENTQDVVPPTERSQDPERSLNELLSEGARPLTDEERKVADRDADQAGAGERVYAPASERVPKTVPQYGEVGAQTDTSTPERQAIGESSNTTSPGSDWPADTEPSFTRVPRPSAPEVTGTTGGEFDTEAHPRPNRWMSNMSTGRVLPISAGWFTLALFGVGIWMWIRWQRERNKPINRLRRQARQAASRARSQAYALRDQMPDVPEDAARPAIGLGTALLSIAILVWQQAQSRSRTNEVKGRADKAARQASRLGRFDRVGRFGREAASNVSDMDWQQRLMQLRDFWNPRRVELEKVSIPKR